MISRQRFAISSTLNATKGDTGRLVGRLEQFSWTPDTNDTGQPCTVSFALCPDDTDTGRGFVFYSAAAVNMGAGFKAERAFATSDTAGSFVEPVIGANDRLRIKVDPADTGVVVAGRFYVWSKG